MWGQERARRGRSPTGTWPRAGEAPAPNRVLPGVSEASAPAVTQRDRPSFEGRTEAFFAGPPGPFVGDLVTCKECGTRYDTSHGFCPRCGSTARGPVTPAAVAVAQRRDPGRRRVQASGAL